MRTDKTIKIKAKDRREVRKQLISYFLDEEPGQGKGELCSHYKYYVEELQDGSRVYLKRPAVLNKGFDFEVHVENMNFGKSRRTTMPSHNIIINDLRAKKKERPIVIKKLIKLIDDLYFCRKIKVEDYSILTFKKGYPVEAILLAIKWLMIEQDITYWNWSGRNMLYGEIKKI
jgi:hypothetical protein